MSTELGPGTDPRGTKGTEHLQQPPTACCGWCMFGTRWTLLPKPQKSIRAVRIQSMVSNAEGKSRREKNEADKIMREKSQEDQQEDSRTKEGRSRSNTKIFIGSINHVLSSTARQSGLATYPFLYLGLLREEDQTLSRNLWPIIQPQHSVGSHDSIQSKGQKVLLQSPMNIRFNL